MKLCTSSPVFLSIIVLLTASSDIEVESVEEQSQEVVFDSPGYLGATTGARFPVTIGTNCDEYKNHTVPLCFNNCRTRCPSSVGCKFTSSVASVSSRVGLKNRIDLALIEKNAILRGSETSANARNVVAVSQGAILSGMVAAVLL
jgi:hypothetical protein